MPDEYVVDEAHQFGLAFGLGCAQHEQSLRGRHEHVVANGDAVFTQSDAGPSAQRRNSVTLQPLRIDLHSKAHPPCRPACRVFLPRSGCKDGADVHGNECRVAARLPLDCLRDRACERHQDFVEFVAVFGDRPCIMDREGCDLDAAMRGDRQGSMHVCAPNIAPDRRQTGRRKKVVRRNCSRSLAVAPPTRKN